MTPTAVGLALTVNTFDENNNDAPEAVTVVRVAVHATLTAAKVVEELADDAADKVFEEKSIDAATPITIVVDESCTEIASEVEELDENVFPVQTAVELLPTMRSPIMFCATAVLTPELTVAVKVLVETASDAPFAILITVEPDDPSVHAVALPLFDTEMMFEVT